MASTTAPKETERVEVYVPKGHANDEPNLFVSVNGVGYLLPKGKKSMVPKAIADEFERAKKAEEAMDQKIDMLLEATK